MYVNEGLVKSLKRGALVARKPPIDFKVETSSLQPSKRGEELDIELITNSRRGFNPLCLSNEASIKK